MMEGDATTCSVASDNSKGVIYDCNIVNIGHWSGSDIFN